MKGIHKSLAWVIAAICLMAVQSAAIAQDDLYYNPSSVPVKTTTVTTTTTYTDEPNQPGNMTKRYNDNDNYSDEDDYAYEYSSRIKRFHRPVQVVDYYDPVFVDLYNYDPFFLPGASIYTYGYNDYWTWRRWQRWHRWNPYNSYDYGWGCNSIGWNSWGWNGYGYGGYNSWNNFSVYNNYYYDPYWTVNGYNPYYNSPWVNNHYYYNNGNNNGNGDGYKPQTYTGARRHGTNVNPGYARLSDNGRLSTPVKNVPMIDMRSRQGGGRASIDKVPGASDRDAIGGRQVSKEVPAGTGRVPNVSDGGRSKPADAGRDADISRRLETPQNTGRDVRPSRGTDETTPSRRNEPNYDRPSRPSRNDQETTPTRRAEPTYERSSRSGNQDATPSRRSEPTRSFESRPSRSESSSRSFESSGSSRSSGSSSGNSGGGSSSRSSSSGSGGGRGGRH
ncbi:MAG: hypothetical protein WCR52_04985 [Bacteroidota bacterium]